MAITFIKTDFPGENGVNPRLVRIMSTDDLATVTSLNYLEPIVNSGGYTIYKTDFIFMTYSAGDAIFTPLIDGLGNITLQLYPTSGPFDTLQNVYNASASGIINTIPNKPFEITGPASARPFSPLTTAQRDAILLPDVGLIVYNTDTNQLNMWNGSAWIFFSPGGAASTINITQDDNTNALMYLVWVNNNSGALAPFVSSLGLAWNPFQDTLSIFDNAFGAGSLSFSSHNAQVITFNNQVNTVFSGEQYNDIFNSVPLFAVGIQGDTVQGYSILDQTNSSYVLRTDPFGNIGPAHATYLQQPNIQLTNVTTANQLVATNGSNYLTSIPNTIGNINITDDNTHNGNVYPVWVTAAGSHPGNISTARWALNPFFKQMTFIDGGTQFQLNVNSLAPTAQMILQHPGGGVVFTIQRNNPSSPAYTAYQDVSLSGEIWRVGMLNDTTANWSIYETSSGKKLLSVGNNASGTTPTISSDTAQDAGTLWNFSNDNNTSNAYAKFNISVGGTIAKYAFYSLEVQGNFNWSMGFDNAAAQTLKWDFGINAAPGTATKMSLTTAGVLNLPSLTPNQLVATDGSNNLISMPATTALAWNSVAGTSQAMSIMNGYITQNGALTTLTLPATAAVGTLLSVQGSGAGGWLIAQNAAQIIHIGSSATTAGVGGSVASTNRYNSVNLICIVADLEWASIGGPEGTLTIV